jgi:hypothetical protein
MNKFSRRLLLDGEPLRQAFKFARPSPQGPPSGGLEVGTRHGQMMPSKALIS